MRLRKNVMGAVLAGITFIFPSIAFAQAYGTSATQTLNVRAGATTNSKIVQQINLGTPVEIVAQHGDWLKLILRDDSRAYVKSDYITVHRVVATVQSNGGALNVRDYPSTQKGKVLGKLYTGDEISVSYRIGDWYKINQEGFEGYVHKDYIQAPFLKYLPKKTTAVRYKKTQAEINSQATNAVAVKKETTNKDANKTTNKKATTVAASTSSSDAKGEQVVSYAKQFVGNPYVYGGNSLTNGVDCSGFTSQIMKNFGISLTRSSAGQYSNNGRAVEIGNLQKGDLVFYGYNGQVSHVAIYIGNQQVIHANDERTGICISGLYQNKPIVGAKRVL